jgi:phage tail sheath protein FI
LTFPGVYIEEIPREVRSIAGVPTSIAAFVGTFPRGPLGAARRIVQSRDFEERFGGPSPVGETAWAVRQFFQNGGRECYVVRAAGKGRRKLSPAAADELIEAISALDNVDIFNLLCVPDTSGLDSGQAARVAAAATDYCTKRGSFYILDVPSPPDDPTDSVEGLRRWIAANSGLGDPNVAVYFPRLKLGSRLLGARKGAVAPSGSVAGVFARTDDRRGVWKAPAGVEAVLRGVQALEVTINDNENRQLDAVGVNCLRGIADKGFLCWGARTFSECDNASPELRYVPVRRTLLFIKESLYRGLKWVTFASNDENLWAQIRQSVGAFMVDLYRQGAFQGETSDKAFFVRCDRETTTKADIDQGFLNLLVGFAPAKPAEFVVISIRLCAAKPAN